MASIILDTVGKIYAGGTRAVGDVSIDIADGEFIVLVGPSGCGKSTLLRMIAGLERITGGDLLIDGDRMNEVPASKRGIAMVFQSYALFPHMTVEQNIIEAPVHAQGRPRAEARRLLSALRMVSGLSLFGPLNQRRTSAATRRRPIAGPRHGIVGARQRGGSAALRRSAIRSSHSARIKSGPFTIRPSSAIRVSSARSTRWPRMSSPSASRPSDWRWL